jgi:hypothetical protein
MSFGQADAAAPSGASSQEQTAPAIAPGDQATKEQLMKLFDVMRIRQQMQTVRAIVPQMVEGQLRQQLRALSDGGSSSNLTPEQRAAAEKLMNQYIEKAVNVYPVDEMLADMTTIYQRYLTREDVDGLIAFYSSSPGRHLLDAQPHIAKEYMPVVMQRAQERTKALTAEMMKDLAAIKEQAAPSGRQPTKQ